MTFEFTNTGLQIDTYDELVAELDAGYRAIYGPDIDTAPESPDGQRIGIEAKNRLDVEALIALLYNNLDPDFASGTSLQQLIKWAGLTMRPATRSSVDVTVTTDRSLTLPAGYAVSDQLKQTWLLDSAAVLPSGATTVTLQAANFGAVAAGIGTVNAPETVVLGVLSVSNPTAASVGQDEETEAALRARRRRSLIAPVTTAVGGIFTALGNVAGVTDLRVYDNDQDTYDATLDMVPHSVWAIVEGGTVADIAEAFARSKSGGTPTKGAITGTYPEELTLPNGSAFTYTHELKFDRPADARLWVSLTVQGPDGGFVDTQAITDALVGREFQIGVGTSASSMYSTVYGIGGEFTATDLEISINGSTYTDDKLTPAPGARFSIAAGDVAITDTTAP